MNILLNGITDFFSFLLPLKSLWSAVVYTPINWLLFFIYDHVQGIPLLDFIGAYGIAVIILTIIIRLVLAPLQQFQLVTQRRSMAEQRKLAPQVAELRKKYKKDTTKLNSEMMKLYQEHGVNPLAPMIGCLPLVVQIPILSALYYVFTTFAHTHGATRFLFVPNLNENPSHHVLFSGLPIPEPAFLVFPLLAALTTLVQSRMLQMPPSPNPTEQEQQTQQMQRTMIWLSPLMIGWFSLNVPAGLGLYWFVGNCVSIIQQSFVVGWGNLLPARFKPGSGGPPQPPDKGSSRAGFGPAGGPNRPKPNPVAGTPQLRPRPANGNPKRRKK